MGAAVISGLFAVVLACLAWILKNGSRRARLLSRIERYTQVLKDLPDGHPARAHLDAALAADSEQLLALTGWKAPEINRSPSAPQPSAPWYPPSPRPAVKPGPAYPPAQRRDPMGAPAGADHGPFKPADDEDPADIDWMGDEGGPGTSSSVPASPALPSPATSAPPAGVTPNPPNPPLPRRALLSGNGSTILWVLAGLSAVAAVGLVINDIFASRM